MNSVQNSPNESSQYCHTFNQADIDGLEPKSFEEMCIRYPGLLTSKDSYQRTILMLAARVGNEALIKLFIEKTDQSFLDETEMNGSTALVHAVLCADRDKAYQCAKLLLEAGANPNIVGSWRLIGEPPLSLAVKYKMDKVIDLLLGD